MDKGALKEVFTVFFKMGCFAFGGPAAHIALMEAEIVEKRKWLDHEKFLDLVGGTSLIPGPNSTEMTMHCGYVRAGKPGLFVAGTGECFVIESRVPAELHVIGIFRAQYAFLRKLVPRGVWNAGLILNHEFDQL